MIEKPYSVGIGLSVVPYIGPDLYSNVPAVLSELIANAWDAGATRVDIDINLQKDTISIKDNGHGMSLKDINSKYLHIGHKKRATSKEIYSVNGKQRHVMGRKGIGKLAPFALAKELEIQSSDGNQKVGCIIEWSKFKLAIDSDLPSFTPIPLANSEITITDGTRLTLRSIQRDKKHSFEDISQLRKQIARRFTIIYPEYDFDVRIDGISITDNDRPYLSKLEFLWHLGESSKAISTRCKNLLRTPTLINNSISVEGKTYIVTGWVGTVEQPSNINVDDNDTIAIFAHGKLAQEDILSEMAEKQVFASYVVGDIQADFLDDDKEDDIITPDRQRLNHSDPRYIKLRKYIKDVALSEISKNWSLWRLERLISLATNISRVNKWYTGLNKSKKRKAARIFRKIIEINTLNDEKKKEYCLIVADHFAQINNRPHLLKLQDGEFANLFERFLSSNIEVSDKTDSHSTDENNTNSNAHDGTSNKDNEESNQPARPADDSKPDSMDSSEDEQHSEALDDDKLTEGKRPEGNRPSNPKSPKYQADYHFGEIRKKITQLAIEKKLKEVTLFDLNQAQIAYNNTANKACIVMLGAVLEGVMLAILRRQDVLSKFNQMSSNELPQFLLNIGIIQQPLNASLLAEKLATSNNIGFEQYRQLIQKLIPNIETQLVVNIQRFRNSIHPYKAISEPDVFAEPNPARAMLYITSLELIVDKFIAWNPSSPN